MEDVEVILSVRRPCGVGPCGQDRFTKSILMWTGMVPSVGDLIDTENGPHKIRLTVIGRKWWNRNLTLLCRPVKVFSIQALTDAGFAESE